MIFYVDLHTILFYLLTFLPKLKFSTQDENHEIWSFCLKKN